MRKINSDDIINFFIPVGYTAQYNTKIKQNNKQTNKKQSKPTWNHLLLLDYLS